MMGHKIEGSKASYFVDNETELKEAYKNCVPYLTIQKELDISESEDFKRIKAEHETLLLEAEKHRVERSELQSIRAELEAEKQSKAELKDNIMKEILDALAVNEQKKIEFMREPTDEQIDELNKPENQFPHEMVPAGTIQVLELSPEEIPEEDTDLVMRILKSEGKKE